MLSNPYPSMQQIERIADVIGVDIIELFASDYNLVNGFIETGDKIYSIKNREQLFDVMDNIDGIVYVPSFSQKSEYISLIKKYIKRSFRQEHPISFTCRYGINQIFTIACDAESKVFLMQYIGKRAGLGDFVAFNIKDYIQDDLWLDKDVDDARLDKLIEDIMKCIEDVK
jgi:hypothetical protein